MFRLHNNLGIQIKKNAKMFSVGMTKENISFSESAYWRIYLGMNQILSLQIAYTLSFGELNFYEKLQPQRFIMSKQKCICRFWTYSMGIKPYESLFKCFTPSLILTFIILIARDWLALCRLNARQTKQYTIPGVF